MKADLLPVGTRIRFLKTIEEGPSDESPGNLYARKDSLGTITGHGKIFPYLVMWDYWKTASFGANNDDFEAI